MEDENMNKSNTIQTEIQRVILVEDDYTASDVISDFLEDEGFEVLSFDSTEEAKKEVKQTDILIVDVRIRNNPSAGVDFIIAIRKDDANFKNAKTIFISNFGRLKEIEEKLQQLEERFIWIDKPFEMSTLALAIEEE